MADLKRQSMDKRYEPCYLRSLVPDHEPIVYGILKDHEFRVVFNQIGRVPSFICPHQIIGENVCWPCEICQLVKDGYKIIENKDEMCTRNPDGLSGERFYEVTPITTQTTPVRFKGRSRKKGPIINRFMKFVYEGRLLLDVDPNQSSRDISCGRIANTYTVSQLITMLVVLGVETLTKEAYIGPVNLPDDIFMCFQYIESMRPKGKRVDCKVLYRRWLAEAENHPRKQHLCRRLRDALEEKGLLFNMDETSGGLTKRAHD